MRNKKAKAIRRYVKQFNLPKETVYERVSGIGNAAIILGHCFRKFYQQYKVGYKSGEIDGNIFSY